MLVVALIGAGGSINATGARTVAAHGPNGAASTSTAGSHGAMRTIPSTGGGTMKYLGKVAFKSLPRATAADLRSSGGQSALRVPHWFKGANVGARLTRSSSGARPSVTTPTHVHLNKGGTRGFQSSCGCQPPDTNGAINGTYIVEAVNLSLTVYKRSGAFVSRKSLASFFPTSRSISDPRIMYDPTAKRWILAFIPIPESTSTTPQMYLAVSTSSNPTGSYFKYTISFSGSLYPLGTLLDYPMMGQDARAMILSTNNFRRNSSGGFNYINSAAFAIPKSAIYSGAGFSFSSFSVAFSTHPAVAQGAPISNFAKSYLLAANGSGGFTLYYLSNTGGTPTMTLQGTTPGSLWSPPPAVTQPPPNQAVHLDSLDGRLQAPPVQASTFLWFTHAINIGGFPGVQYGAINLATSGSGGVSASTNVAYASGTSNDWNPSIALVELSTNSDRIFLNWAVDDPAAGQNVGQRVSGVGPGEGIPSLAGIGTTLFTGGGSPSQTRFGDFSSTTMEVSRISSTCPANTQALVVNQVFNGGDWQVRLARVGTC